VKIALSEISTPGASFAEDVSACAAAGFDGIADVEIFSTPEAFWGLPVAEAAQRAAAAARSLMTQS
jgi:sugar phosphate isomerase/epimerase